MDWKDQRGSDPWGKFVFFSDPDGDKWSIQEIPPRG
jgi:hypothetical protein